MRRSPAKGFTYLELMATAAIIMILASAVLPMARVAVRRQKELELRRQLRILRTAIDDFKTAAKGGSVCGTDLKATNENYPSDLETLVNGINACNTVGVKKIKFLRRIPIDPMTGKAEWGMRCYQDEPDSDSWCGDNVYDVYTKSTATTLDGSQKYRDW